MIAVIVGAALVTTGDSWLVLLGAALLAVGFAAWWEDSRDGG